MNQSSLHVAVKWRPNQEGPAAAAVRGAGQVLTWDYVALCARVGDGFSGFLSLREKIFLVRCRGGNIPLQVEFLFSLQQL